MCSNYRPVTLQDRLLAHFGVIRPNTETPTEAWPGYTNHFAPAAAAHVSSAEARRVHVASEQELEAAIRARGPALVVYRNWVTTPPFARWDDQDGDDRQRPLHLASLRAGGGRPTARARLFSLMLLLAALCLIWFVSLGTRSLITPDEGRYATLALEMARSGDWVTPRLNGLL